jgi:hypothetical protein
LTARYVLLGFVFLVLSGLWGGTIRAEDLDYRRVTRDELVAAMQHAKGFDPRATTNGARFQAEVLFELVNAVADSGRLDKPMLVSREDWFRAFLVKTNLTEDAAPQYIKLAYKNKQCMWIDARMDRVIEKVKKGDRPVQALNVLLWWPEEKGTKSEYSYKDTLSTPNLDVTNHRVITYRLLNFGDRFFFDDINGLSGRPTTGLLGLLFKLIGSGRVVKTGMAVSEDGLLVLRGSAKKAFMGVTTTATIQPNGKSKKDVPEGRPDLKALEELLKIPFEMKYEPFKWSSKMDQLLINLELAH